MAKRMTTERLVWFRLQRRDVDAMGLRVDPHFQELHDEVERARRVEQEQAETIRVLADALESVRDSGVKLPAVAALRVDAALRIVGRFP